MPQDDDLSTTPPQQQSVPPRPRIAPAEVLFDRPHRGEHRDALDALAALNAPRDQRC